MNGRFNWLYFALLLPATLAGATLEGPRLGLLFDPGTRALRPIMGIPGAAFLGEPLELDIELARAAVSPGQDYVVATVGERREVVLLRVSSSGVKRYAIANADPAPDDIVLSANGRIALLYHKQVNRLQVITGLPDAPKAGKELYLSAGESPSALAVSDDGNVVLAGVAGSLKHITANGEVPVFPGAGKISAIAFGPNYTVHTPGEAQDVAIGSRPSKVTKGGAVRGYTALVADATHNRLYRVRDLTGNVAPEIIATAAEGMDTPSAIAVSQDRERAFIANAKNGTVSILSLRGTPAHKVLSCGCAPTSLERMNGDVFRLTTATNKPIWLLQVDEREPRVVFVPAVRAGAASDAK